MSRNKLKEILSAKLAAEGIKAARLESLTEYLINASQIFLDGGELPGALNEEA